MARQETRTRKTRASAAKSRSRAKRATRAAKGPPPAPARQSPKGAAEWQLTPWKLKDEEVEAALARGERPQELEQIFGEAELRELQDLARRARSVSRGLRGGKPVLILPGIMGSKLGRAKNWLGVFDDVFWLDPIDVAFGKLKRLALGSKPTTVDVLGVFLFVYLRLKLELRAAGFDAEFHPFDWRLSLAESGRELRRRLLASKRPVSLVCHSMGGLVARAALREGIGDDKVDRVVQLGTPNYGSFAPILALRGAHSVVRMVAALDLGYDKADYIANVFTTFPGLCEMMPSLPGHGGARFFRLDAWPGRSAIALPSARQLARAAGVQELLAPVDERMTLIAGVNQETVVRAELVDDELEFHASEAGDGTVPLELARVAGLKTYYAEEGHGSLPGNGSVIRAVEDLLETGATEALPTRLPPPRRATIRKVRESELRGKDPFEGKPRVATRGGGPARPALSGQELRAVLQPFVAPAAAVAPGEARGAATLHAGEPETPWKRMIVGRARQHRLDLSLANASITDVEARAYVLGLFREVAPSGAAAAIDARLGGTIGDFTRRRMFSGNVGEVFVMPASRRNLRAEMVLFAGLGFFDQFNDDVGQVAAENVMRTFACTRVEDFATVLLGAASGLSTARLVENLLRGILRGKLDADADQHFRRIVLCELDPARYQEIRREVLRLAATAMFEDVELTLTELEPVAAPETVLAPVGRRPTTVVAKDDPVYLIVRQVKAKAATQVVHTSVLTAGAKAAVILGTRSVPEAKLDALLERAQGGNLRAEVARRIGEELAGLMLSEEVAALLPGWKHRHLVVVHDTPASRTPWELLRLGEWLPALGAGVSRRLMAENLSVAKYLEQRADAARLHVLVVVDPTEDLPGAAKEGDRIIESLKPRKDVRLEVLRNAEATRQALLARLRSGDFDVVHYAGHAYFDPEVRSRSGLVCSDGELTGSDLNGLGDLPRLVFFNACESGRVRGAPDGDTRSTRVVSKRSKREEELERVAGRKRLREERVAPAEAFLRCGIANFIGTYWPVNDAAAESFSGGFYDAILDSATMGEAMLIGRKAAQAAGSTDWADYIHYGDPGFVLMKGRSASGGG